MIFDSLQQSGATSSGGDTGGSSGGGLITQNTLVTVGAGGDYPTINAALEYLSQFSPVFKSSGIKAEVRLLAGFVMAEQVMLRGVDLGWISITGADNETSIDRSALLQSVEARWPAFCGIENAVLPAIGQLFLMSSSGESDYRDGIYLTGSSRSLVLPGCGIKAAGSIGANVNAGSFLTAIGSDFQNAGYAGILAERGSVVSASGSNVSGNGFYGLRAIGGSRVDAHSLSATGSLGYGIGSQSGALVNADSGNFTGARNKGIEVWRGGFVSAYGATGTLSQVANTPAGHGLILQ